MKANANDVRLVARWQPDAAQGDIVRDETGHGLDGKVVRNRSAAAEDAGILAGVSPPVAGAAWSSTAEGDLRLTIPAGENPLRFTLKVARVPNDGGREGSGRVDQERARDEPRRAHARRPRSMAGGLEDRDRARPRAMVRSPSIRSGFPENNPWLCQLRLTGFDFLDGGRQAAVCTWDGDVWLVSGLDAPSGELSWKRIASGLFQPLGLKIRDGNIFVGCRDQIVILRDLERRRRDRLL